MYKYLIVRSTYDIDGVKNKRCYKFYVPEYKAAPKHKRAYLKRLFLNFPFLSFKRSKGA